MPEIHNFGQLSYEFDTESVVEPQYSHYRFFDGGESDETDIMLDYWRVKDDDVVIDVGAHIGTWTLPALAMNARHVYAFEPSIDAINILRKNIELNHWSDRAKILPFALWHKEEKKRLYEIGLTIVTPSTSYHYDDEYDVECKTLDSFHFEKVDWIKIDAEGAELAILIGAKETLLKHRPNMIIEIHEKMIQTIIPDFQSDMIKNWLPPCKIINIKGWKDTPRVLVTM